MNDFDPNHAQYRQHLRVMKIIAFALILGILTFLGIVLYLLYGAGPPPPVPEVPMVSYLALGFFVVTGISAMIVPNIMSNTLINKIADGTWTTFAPNPLWDDSTDWAKLISVYQTRMILRFALLEGAAFFALIAHLIEQQPFTLGIVGVVLFFMLLFFPTHNRVSQWIDQQLFRIRDLRQS